MNNPKQSLSNKEAAKLPENQPEDFYRLPREKQAMLIYWIKECLACHKIKTFYLDGITSYGLKHRFQNSNIGFYVSNGAYKGAMVHLGFKPRDQNELNWSFQLGRQAGIKKDVVLPLGV